MTDCTQRPARFFTSSKVLEARKEGRANHAQTLMRAPQYSGVEGPIVALPSRKGKEQELDGYGTHKPVGDDGPFCRWAKGLAPYVQGRRNRSGRQNAGRLRVSSSASPFNRLPSNLHVLLLMEPKHH